MCRPGFIPLGYNHQLRRWQDCWARLLVPLTIWICVAVTLRYGFYGDCHMMLGPSSSRLFKANTMLVKQVEVRDDARKGVFLYGFSEKPQLSSVTNWSVSNYMIVGSYSRKGFYLWMNKGSRIWMRWEARTSCLGKLQVSLVKGERDYETLLPSSMSSSNAYSLKEPEGGLKSTCSGKEAQYIIEEDDRYYVGIINSNPRSIIMIMDVNVSSKMYDTMRAKSMCSTTKGSCRLNLLFPKTEYVIISTPNSGDLGRWYIEISFVARVLTYIAILGFFVIIIYLMLKYLGACDSERQVEEFPAVREITETFPLMPEKTYGLPYGTGEEEGESGTSSSSEDLYDGKICVICYDMLRNCFFVPCGHCATCYDCAQRIMDGESKMCPICRRLIHKVRKLIIP